MRDKRMLTWIKTAGEAIAIAALFGLGMIGCASRPPAPAAQAADMVAVQGITEIEGARPGQAPTATPTPAPRFSQIVGREFSSESSAAAPPAAANQAQRLAFARAEARRGALRKLAEQAAQFPSDDGPPLGQLMNFENNWAARLQEFLERAPVEFVESPDRIDARARVSGKDLAQALALRLTDAEAPPRPAEPGIDPAKRDEAQARALKAARDRLYEEIVRMQIGDGTLRQALERDPALQARIQQMVDATEPKAIVFTPDGQCKANLEFDRNRVRALLPHE